MALTDQNHSVLIESQSKLNFTIYGYGIYKYFLGWDINSQNCKEIPASHNLDVLLSKPRISAGYGFVSKGHKMKHQLLCAVIEMYRFKLRSYCVTFK